MIMIFVGIGTMPIAYTDTVPDLAKNTAGWLADDVISDSEFVNTVQFLVNERVINVGEN